MIPAKDEYITEYPEISVPINTGIDNRTCPLFRNDCATSGISILSSGFSPVFTASRCTDANTAI